VPNALRSEFVRQQPDFFGDEELTLVYIGKRLSRSLEAEKLLTAAGIDYAVEVDQYVGGVIFRTSRAGAFIYVRPDDYERAAESLKSGGIAPQAGPA
jgi:vacuolar-type H+-ATPase subunit E/Vma4